jgi:multisubunit Na+/H+ antiporter MnhC subunit
MEACLAMLVGLMTASALYLMLSASLLRFVFGFMLLGNAVNLTVFAAGRLEHTAPPLIPDGGTTLSGPAANALPQALVLTAIVIGFAMVTFLLVLLLRTCDHTRTLDTDEPVFFPETGTPEQTGAPDADPEAAVPPLQRARDRERGEP